MSDVNTVVDANTPEDNTWDETHLDAHLLDFFNALPQELKKHLVGVTSNRVLRSLLVRRQHVVLASVWNLKPKDAGELWNKFLMLQLEGKFLQDIVTFLDEATKVLSAEFDLELIPGDEAGSDGS